ncbi:lipopolysaccharide biosynthesis protein [Acidiphilium sp.]|uniref:lipopolysaccharide biosynthesis protein n=1 Tax=Acidiphilium sp. TaxID=527 RepID=UPI0025831D31|nr:lipopolysaccharide biosynthesis protein [Acidiphilium sp.]
MTADPGSAGPRDGTASQDAGLASLAGEGSILSRTARGAGWVIGWRFCTRFIGLFSTLILVRLLTPADFGIVALATSFVQGFGQLCEVGVEDAIIRDPDPDRALYDTGFTINLIRGFGVALVLLIGAFPIAALFHNPNLAPVLLAVAGISALGAMENIGVVDFRRFIAFDREFVLKIIPRIVQTAIGITLSFILRSYWALIIALLSNQAITTIMTYQLHPFRPRLSLAAWRRMAGYSAWVWVNNLISLLNSNGTNFIIGKMLGVGAVGIFGLGKEIAGLPNTELVGPLCRSAFSGFAQAQADGDNGANLLLRLLALMTIIALPAGLGLSLTAYPIVQLGFGKNWIGAVPLLQVIGVANAFSIFSMISWVVFSVRAWMKALVKIGSAITLIRFVLIIVLLPVYGLTGVAIAIAGTDIIGQIVFIVVTVHRLDLSLTSVLGRVWRSVTAAAMMTALLVVLHLGWRDDPGTDRWQAIHLGAAVLIGAISYTASLIGLWLLAGRPEGAERDLLDFLRAMLRRIETRRLPA